METHRSRIRICYAVDAPYAGGAEKYILLLASALDRGTFEPIVLAKTGGGLDAWCERVVGSGVEVVRAPMELPFRADHAIPLVARLSAIGPHLVHINLPGPYDGQMGLLAPLARVAGSAGVVVTEHLPRVDRLWKRALVKRVSYHWVDRVVTVCHSNLPHLLGRQRVPEHKTRVVYNGVPAAYGAKSEEWREAARCELGLGPAAVGIVFVGSLIERKGMGILVDALDGLRSNGWRLFVIGTGDGEGAYRAAVRERGLGESVRFLGGVTEDRVERTLCAVDLLVLPSYMEGMPYAVLEAMACSLPVIASRVDGIPEAVPDGEAGLLVSPGDAPALRNAIGRLLGDAPLRRQLGANGRRRFARFFTLDRHVEQMQSVYFGLLAGG